MKMKIIYHYFSLIMTILRKNTTLKKIIYSDKAQCILKKLLAPLHFVHCKASLSQIPISFSHLIWQRNWWDTSFSQNVSRLSTFLAPLWCILLYSSTHLFTILLRDNHSGGLIFWSVNYDFGYLNLCFGLMTSWMSQIWPIFMNLAVTDRFWFKMKYYKEDHSGIQPSDICRAFGIKTTPQTLRHNYQ